MVPPHAHAGLYFCSCVLRFYYLLHAHSSVDTSQGLVVLSACSHPHCLQLWVVESMCVPSCSWWKEAFPLLLFFFKLFSLRTRLIYSEVIETSALMCFLSFCYIPLCFSLSESSADHFCKYFRFSSPMSQITETKQVSELRLETFVSSQRLAKPIFPSKHGILSPHLKLLITISEGLLT